MTTDASAHDVEIVVNGAPHAVPRHCDLAALVDRLGHREDAVSTAVNGEFVARARRLAHPLHAGDRVDCFQLIVGG
jgi:sulfur carrier protein